MTKMVVQEGGWALSDSCLADSDFLKYLDGWHYSRILHMGTGMHHLIGQSAKEHFNQVYGLTICVEEVDEYMKLVQDNPELAHHYICIFNDIYLIHPDFLPQFDLVTLFHLGEMPDDRRQKYGCVTDEQVIRIMINKLRVGGRLVFYKDSSAFENIDPILQTFSDDGMLEIRAPFNSLLVFSKAKE